MDDAAAREVLTWVYAPPYDVYSLDPARADEELAYMLDPANRFYAMRGPDGTLQAFCSIGADAQVPGGAYDDSALDIGLGVRPELTGQGHGHLYVEAVIAFARRTFAPAVLRVTIAGFNRRAQRVWHRAGFVPTQRFLGPGGALDFVVLVRVLED